MPADRDPPPPPRDLGDGAPPSEGLVLDADDNRAIAQAWDRWRERMQGIEDGTRPLPLTKDWWINRPTRARRTLGMDARGALRIQCEARDRASRSVRLPHAPFPLRYRVLVVATPAVQAGLREDGSGDTTGQDAAARAPIAGNVPRTGRQTRMLRPQAPWGTELLSGLNVLGR